LGALPIPRPSKIVCVGRNYLAHAQELGNEIPDEPLIFFKPPSALLAPGDAILLPPNVGQVHFEGEVGVLLGRTARNVSPDEARDCVAAVLPLNDITARDLQRSDPQWTRAKGFDTFCPVGAPIPAQGLDLESLQVVTTVNGEERQRGDTADMAFSIATVISWISRIMTLEPGDLLATGTPEGVGPLSPGDQVEILLLDSGGSVLGAVANPVQPAPVL